MDKIITSVEIPYLTREDIRRADDFKFFLDNFGVGFDCSGAGNMIHFSLFVEHEQIPAIDKALDRLVWYDAITERR